MAIFGRLPSHVIYGIMPGMSQPPPIRLWLARLLIGIVLFWNVQCALIFMLAPATFAPGFELSGGPARRRCAGWACCF